MFSASVSSEHGPGRFARGTPLSAAVLPHEARPFPGRVNRPCESRFTAILLRIGKISMSKSYGVTFLQAPAIAGSSSSSFLSYPFRILFRILTFPPPGRQQVSCYYFSYSFLTEAKHISINLGIRLRSDGTRTLPPHRRA